MTTDKGLIKGRWASRNPNIMNLPRGAGKALFSGMDFAKLEDRTAALMVKLDGKTTMTSSPTMRSKSNDDVLDAMIRAMQSTMSGRNPVFVWGDELVYTPPTSKLTNQVNKIIDDFWELKCCSLGELYIKQLERNPKTKDVFKGKSTTHHYPWYRKGSKY